MAAPKTKPPPLTPKEIDSIETMAGLGLTVDKIGAVLGMSKATIERRLKSTPEAHEALSKGRAKAENAVASTAYEMAISGKCPAMTIFFLKCRARWKEDAPPDPDENDQGVTVYETQFGSTPVIAPKKTNP